MQVFLEFSSAVEEEEAWLLGPISFPKEWVV